MALLTADSITIFSLSLGSGVAILVRFFTISLNRRPVKHKEIIIFLHLTLLLILLPPHTLTSLQTTLLLLLGDAECDLRWHHYVKKKAVEWDIKNHWTCRNIHLEAEVLQHSELGHHIWCDPGWRSHVVSWLGTKKNIRREQFRWGRICHFQ